MDEFEKKNAPIIKENKMGTMPENKLLITMSVPIMISMIVQALYNIVDSVFVAQISENALTAVSLAFPMQNFIISVGVGTGVGVNALLSKSLGEKNQYIADKSANQAILLSFLSWIVFLFIGVFGAHYFFSAQTDVKEIVDYGTSYLSICCSCSLFVFLQIAFERILQSTGRTVGVMFIQAIGAIVNIILDPVLIFGLFGLPRLEVSGAAIATVIGQCVAMIFGLILNLKWNKDIHLEIRQIKPNAPVIKKIYSVGVPSIIMGSIGSVMTLGMNQILLAFTTTATAVFGVYFKLQSFFFMPVFGLNNGIVPIIAYNYGAKQGERMGKTIKLGVIYATILMLLGVACFQLFPEFFLKLFKASDDMLSIGVPCLRIISVSFIFAGFCIVCGSVFQALGNGFLSLWVSVGRQLVVLLPAAFILSKFGDVALVWWAFPIAEIASLTISTIFLRRIFKHKILPLKKQTDDKL